MMKIVRSLAVFSFIASPLFAQQGIHVSNTDPRWGEKITVGYIAEDTSAFAKADSRDTLYCAAVVKGARPEHAIILTMRHVSGASYETELTVPDSTNSMQILIGTPTEDAHEGNSSFTCRTADGKPTPGYALESTRNMDSALDLDRAAYPKHYRAYFRAYDFGKLLSQAGVMKRSDAEWQTALERYIERMRKSPDTTLEWSMTLTVLYARAGDDSMANVALRRAAACQSYDPIVNDGMFWGRLFYPQMRNGKYQSSYEFGRTLAPLFERFPHTAMASEWLDMMSYDTLLAAPTFRRVADAWVSSHDVDVLESIAQTYGYEKSPAYDAKQAMVWCDRAYESWRTRAGYYSGENIYSSMSGRIGGIAALRIRLLGKAGKIDETARFAATVKPFAHEIYDKQQIGAALAKAYLDADRIEDAKRAYGEQLAFSTRGVPDGLKELYQKSKEESETLSEFSKRLVKEYGSKIELPAVPNFAFKTLDGTKGTLAGLRGKVVVLDCWFISCPGCNIEKASLNKLVESFRGDTNVVFLSIATDGVKALRRYLEETPSKFTIIPNGDPICQKIGVTGFPTHIIIGKDGRTLGNEMGGSEHEDEQMRPKILEALGKS